MRHVGALLLVSNRGKPIRKSTQQIKVAPQLTKAFLAGSLVFPLEVFGFVSFVLFVFGVCNPSLNARLHCATGVRELCDVGAVEDVAGCWRKAPRLAGEARGSCFVVLLLGSGCFWCLR